MSSAKKAFWPAQRLGQLEKLRRMLVEMRSLNSGSHAFTKALRCSKDADALLQTNLTTGRPDFIQFLISQAWLPMGDVTEALDAAEIVLAEGLENCGGDEDNVFHEPLVKVRAALAKLRDHR